MTNTYVLDLKKVFDDFVKGQTKDWTDHDRSTTVGASEVFNCLRQLCFEKRGEELGYEPDEDYDERWGATFRGSTMEGTFIAPALQTCLPDDLEFHFGGEDQVTLKSGRGSATPDGLITGLPKGCTLVVTYGDKDIEIEDIVTDCIVVEIKTINPFMELFDEKENHRRQAIIQMGHIRENSVHEPHYGIVIYVESSWWDDIDIFDVEYDEDIYKASHARANDVFAVKDVDEILPEGKMSGECTYCRWKTACGVTTLNGIPKDDGLPDIPSELKTFFEEQVDAYMSAKVAEKTAQADAKDAQERLKELLMDLEQPKAQGDGWKVSWASVAGRKSIDKQAMIDDGLDIRKYEKEGRPYDVLRVTAKKK